MTAAHEHSSKKVCSSLPVDVVDCLNEISSRLQALDLLSSVDRELTQQHKNGLAYLFSDVIDLVETLTHYGE